MADGTGNVYSRLSGNRTYRMRDYDLHTQEIPALDRLDEAGADAIHEASMEIVESIGIKLNHEEAQAVFEEHGADVDDEGIVTVSRDLIEGRVRSRSTGATPRTPSRWEARTRSGRPGTARRTSARSRTGGGVRNSRTTRTS